jgi:hypothetical protein
VSASVGKVAISVSTNSKNSFVIFIFS